MKLCLALIAYLAVVPACHSAGGDWSWEGEGLALYMVGMIEKEGQMHSRTRQGLIVLSSGLKNDNGQCFEIFLKRDNEYEKPVIYCEKSAHPPLSGVVWVYDEAKKNMKCVNNCGKGVPKILTYNPGD